MDKENLGNSQEREVLVERQVSIYASSRAVMYAIASDLAASPFDAKPAVVDSRVCINDLNLPYHLIGFQELLD
ncbi:MAG: hypothetical protein VYA80_05650, partial [Pseudomonadota bacterium]|nr:hypothetical protein [Pseudomonadota bacterium]